MLAEYLDLQRRARLCELGFHHAERQRLAEPETVAAAGRAADQLTVLRERVVAERIGVIDIVDL